VLRHRRLNAARQAYERASKQLRWEQLDGEIRRLTLARFGHAFREYRAAIADVPRDELVDVQDRTLKSLLK
jgi:hypothetical protein